MHWLVRNWVSIVSLVWLIIRVGFVITASLAVFLTVFLGYLTIPLLVLTAFLLLWTGFDLRRRIQKLFARRHKAEGEP